MSIFVNTIKDIFFNLISKCVALFRASFNVKIVTILIFLAFKTEVFLVLARNKREQKALKSIDGASRCIKRHGSYGFALFSWTLSDHEDMFKLIYFTSDVETTNKSIYRSCFDALTIKIKCL